MKKRTSRREKSGSQKTERKWENKQGTPVIPVKDFDPVLRPLIVLVQLYLSWLLKAQINICEINEQLNGLQRQSALIFQNT